MIYQILRTCVCLIVLSAQGNCNWPAREETAEYWNEAAEKTLHKIYGKENIKRNPAKNVILFIGDGMGLSTATAGRILKGQNEGRPGEETISALDKFPNVGLSKVYCVDKQSPDSASTATAILSGVKTKFGVLGLNGRAVHKKCSSAAGNEVESILTRSANLGKSTGIVTTTEVQHATPAAAYAHSASRGWYVDSAMNSTTKSEGCKDISLQLLAMGRKINVVLGGGRAYMRPDGAYDEEYFSRRPGMRDDGRDLIREWKNLQPSSKARYVWRRSALNAVNADNTDYLLGLFQPKELRYDHDRNNDIAGEPSLEEMTEKAIQILRKNPSGYFLLVEGGKMDHAHHYNQANIALREFLVFEKAVQKAMDMTSTEDALIVVTADHGHVFTLGGYADRGNPIHGYARNHNEPRKAVDKHQYTSIAYANGPGYTLDTATGKRKGITGDTTRDIAYRYQAAVPLTSETHSAEDTVVFARGPMSYLFNGSNKSLCERPATTTTEVVTTTAETPTTNPTEIITTTLATTTYAATSTATVPTTDKPMSASTTNTESTFASNMISNMMNEFEQKLFNESNKYSSTDAVSYLKLTAIIRLNGTSVVSYDMSVVPFVNQSSTTTTKTTTGVHEQSTNIQSTGYSTSNPTSNYSTSLTETSKAATSETVATTELAKSTLRAKETTTASNVATSKQVTTFKPIFTPMSTERSTYTSIVPNITTTGVNLQSSNEETTILNVPTTKSMNTTTQKVRLTQPTFSTTSLSTNTTHITLTISSKTTQSLNTKYTSQRLNSTIAETTIQKTQTDSPENRIFEHIRTELNEMQRCMNLAAHSSFKLKLEKLISTEVNKTKEKQQALIIALATISAMLALSTLLLLALLIRGRSRVETNNVSRSTSDSRLSNCGSERTIGA